MRLGHTVYATPVGAFLKIGQPLTGAVLNSNSQCERQVGENAGDLTLAVTICEIMD